MSENYLIHIGTKNSGRYPRGSGERPHQHDGLSPMKRYKIDFKQKRHDAFKARKEYKRNPSVKTYTKYQNAKNDWLNYKADRLMKQEHKDAKNNYKALKEKYEKNPSAKMKIKVKDARKLYKSTFSNGKYLAITALAGPLGSSLYTYSKMRQTISRKYND